MSCQTISQIHSVVKDAHKTCRGAERPYICRSRPFQPQQSFWASENSSSNYMGCTARVGVETDVASVAYKKWYKRRLNALEAMSCSDLPQSANLASTTLAPLASKLRSMLSGLMSCIIKCQPSRILQDKAGSRYRYGLFLSHAGILTRIKHCERRI